MQRHSICRHRATLFGLVFILFVAGDVSGQLRTALEVRSLEFATAEAGLDVDLTGVVIYADPPGTILVQDETAGTFFQLKGRVPPRLGDVVRVRGITYPGLYLPGIKDCEFEVLEHRGLPAAHPARFEDLTSGRFHYQRVAVEGIVRNVFPDEEDASVARVALGAQIIDVQVREPPSNRSLVDSRVRISGLAAGHINSRRQLVDPYLRCSDWSEFEFLSKAPALEDAPVVSTEQLLTFDVEGQGGHRLRIGGEVLAIFPGGELYIRDEASAVRVRLQEEDIELQIGDRIEVIGFPEMAKFSASVVDAILLDRGPGPLPVPVKSQMGDLLDGESDGQLVSVEATITDSYRSAFGHALVLQDGEKTLHAEVPSLSGPLEPGSLIRVTGICRVETLLDGDYRTSPASVSLRLRSGRDVEVLSAPDWWTAERLALGSMILLAAVLLGGLWIASLRGQVIRQTDALRGRIENEAALEERHRIAREFHDTLEQELAGLSLRLDAAAARVSDDKLGGVIKGSRSLVTRIQTETRNLVSDLREVPGQSGSIANALRELADGHPDEVTPSVRADASAEIPDLPSHVVHHLKRIAQEAIANVIKHAGATSVVLDAKVAEDCLVMSIADDGTGFDAATETHGKSGHFGCMGIRERCRKIGAQVEWGSDTGKGTVVRVNMPMKS